MVNVMNNWTESGFYHNSKGRILGMVSEFNGQHKAVLNGIFIGFYINKEYAMKAVEEAYRDSLSETTPREY